MKDSLIVQVDYVLPETNKISIQTPIGSVDTGDDSPVLDVLIVGLIFGAFCLWIYARFFHALKK